MPKIKTSRYFKTETSQIPLPVFFPDATRGVVKTLDSTDIKETQTPGILVNTYHLYRDLGRQVIKKHGGIRGFMNWQGGVISDSGGFQIMTLIKASSQQGRVTDEGVIFRPRPNKKILFTPEKSIQFQLVLKPDMLVVLDDFTPPQASFQEAKETVKRSIIWAKRCKKEFEIGCQKVGLTQAKRPYLLAVVQGGDFLDLRKECAVRLAEIGFDGYGYGGWPITPQGNFNYEIAQCIADNTPKGSLLYGLGIGKPEEIVGCVNLGYQIFDCVLPTRDARHRRLYVYEAKSIEEIDVNKPKFYSFYKPDKEKYYQDDQPLSQACDCLLCRNYSRAYLAHLFRIEEMTALRLATIHNLRFYSILMARLQKQAGNQ